MNDRRSIAPTVLPLLFIVAFAVVWHYVVGPPNWVALGTSIAAYPVYLATFRSRLPDPPRRFVVIYLAALAWQAVHGAEEMLAHVDTGNDEAWPPAAQALSTLLDAGYLLGAIGVLIGNHTLSFFACAFAFRCLLNGVGHPALALRDGLDSPGLVTGTLQIVFAALLFHAIAAVRRRT